MAHYDRYGPAPVPTLIRSGARLEGACGAWLTGLRGSAWITVDGERRDIVLEPGDTFVVDSNRLVLVQPLRAGGALELRLAPRGARPACRPVPVWQRALQSIAAALRLPAWGAA